MLIKGIQYLKKLWVYCFVSFALTLLISFPSIGISVDQVQNPRLYSGDWITDQAQVLDSETEKRLNQKITEFEEKTTVEMSIVTISKADQAVRPFSIALFNRWGIGKARSNNGVLLLLSIGDRRVEIVTGYGIERILTDAIAVNIIEKDILPAMRQGDPNQVLLQGTERIIQSILASERLATNFWPLDFRHWFRRMGFFG